MEDAQSRLLILPPAGNAAAEAAALSLAIPVATVALAAAPAGAAPELAVEDRPYAGANASAPRLASPAAAAAAADASAPPPAPLPSDVARFLHPSGTSSKPKGVPLTHANIAASLANIVATYELTKDDVSYMVMPLFHVHGLMAGTFSPLAAGGAIVLPAAGKFSASVFWRDCVEHGATFYTAVPTMHQVCVRGRRPRSPRAHAHACGARSCGRAQSRVAQGLDHCTATGTPRRRHHLASTPPQHRHHLASTPPPLTIFPKSIFPKS